MNHEYDELDDRVTEYIRGELDEASAARLEIEMLDDDALFAQVQAETLLRRGLQSADLPREKQKRYLSRWMPWQGPGSALIAALSFCVLGLGIWNLALTSQLSSQQTPQVNVPVITLYNERSLLTEPPLTQIADDDAAALIEIDVSAHGDQAFGLRIEMGEKIHRRENIRPDDRGYLTVLVPDAGSIESIRVLDRHGRDIHEYQLD